MRFILHVPLFIGAKAFLPTIIASTASRTFPLRCWHR